jgi:hypothetical protein
MASEFSTDLEEASVEGNDLEERIAALETRNQQLEAENERLRSVTGPRVSYRAAAILLILVSVAAVGGTVVYPESRDVLIGIAGTGAFGAILLGMLVQEWLLSASVGRALYDTLWENERRIASRLGVSEASRYVPTNREPLGVRLYLSRSLDDPIPPSDALGSTVVTVDGRYTLLLEPTGREFVAILERTNGELPEDLRTAAVVLREAIVEQFELAVGVEVVDLEVAGRSERNRLRVRVWGSVLGDATRLDHPIRSFIGVGLAKVVEQPVESEAWTDDAENAVLTFHWGGGTPEATDDGSTGSGPDRNP